MIKFYSFTNKPLFFFKKIGQKDEKPKFKEKNNKPKVPFKTTFNTPGFKRNARTVSETGKEKL